MCQFIEPQAQCSIRGLLLILFMCIYSNTVILYPFNPAGADANYAIIMELNDSCFMGEDFDNPCTTHAGIRVLSELERCQASVGAACHSHAGSKPSPILIACGVPEDIAINAMRLSIGRDTTKKDIDTFIGDLANAVKKLQHHCND